MYHHQRGTPKKGRALLSVKEVTGGSDLNLSQRKRAHHDVFTYPSKTDLGVVPGRRTGRKVRRFVITHAAGYTEGCYVSSRPTYPHLLTSRLLHALVFIHAVAEILHLG